MTEQRLISIKYKALFKETFTDVLDATGNERVAEAAALEHVLSAALLSAAVARREMETVTTLRRDFGIGVH